MKVSVAPASTQPPARYVAIRDMQPGQIGVLASRERNEPRKMPWYTIMLQGGVTLDLDSAHGEDVAFFARVMPNDGSPVRLLAPGESFTITVTA